jgi:hypothetical protein
VTALIACILIYHFNMQWWWYLIVVILNGGKGVVIFQMHKELLDGLFRIKHEALKPAAVDRVLQDVHEKLDQIRRATDRD